MANTFITPQVLANSALAALLETNVLISLVSRDYEADLTRRAIGDSVDIRIPGTFEAKRWTPGTEVTYQDVTETKVQVKLDKVHDVSVKANAIENTQSIENLQTQIMVPAMQALARGIEREALATLTGAASTEVGTGTDNGMPYAYTHPKVLIEAGAQLDTALAAPNDRYAVIGTGIKSNWLDKLSTFQEVGDLENAALREASVGRIQAFDVFSTPNIKAPAAGGAPGTPSTEVGVAFQRGAAALAIGTLNSEVADQGIAQQDGIAIRVTRAYEPRLKEDLYSFDVLWGLNVLRPKHITLIKGADNS